jgi:hypothetical protein
VTHTFSEPILVAVQSEPWVCGCSIPGIVGLDPAEGSDVHVLCWLCVV